MRRSSQWNTAEKCRCPCQYVKYKAGTDHTGRKTGYLYESKGYDADRIRIGAAGTFEKEEDAGWWLKLVRQTFPDTEVYYRPLSCSIASHVGVDATGIGVCVVNG